MSEFGKYNAAIAGMTDLERLLCFLAGAHYCGTTTNRHSDLKEREYDHDFTDDGGSLITIREDTGATVSMSFAFTKTGALNYIHARRI